MRSDSTREAPSWIQESRFVVGEEIKDRHVWNPMKMSDIGFLKTELN